MLLTATFLAIPDVDPRWREHVERAIALARQAHPEQVWLTLAPGERLEQVVEATPVDGVVLETWTDPDGLIAAVRAIRAVWDGPLVGSMVPSPAVPDDLPERLAEAGATGAGLNCGTEDQVLAVVERWSDRLPLWLEPSPPFRRVDALRRRARWLGGCCGTGPDELRQLSGGGP